MQTTPKHLKRRIDMQRVYEFLKEAKTYYLATVDKDQPRVRPFGTVDLFEGKLYFQTGKVKEVSRQLPFCLKDCQNSNTEAMILPDLL